MAQLVFSVSSSLIRQGEVASQPLFQSLREKPLNCNFYHFILTKILKDHSKNTNVSPLNVSC